MSAKDKKPLVPRLRFAEFRETEGWSNSSLEELYSFKATNSFSREQLNYEIGEVKNIHYGDIHTKFSSSFNIKEESVPFIKPTESLEKIKHDCYCEEGDIIFADASEDLNDVGKSIEIVSLNNQKLLSGLHTLLIRQKKLRLVIGFGGYLFKSSRIRAQIKREAQGTKVLGISSARISRIDIAFPINKKEQQKIAACLTALDDLISAATGRLDALKQHKQGLMQQLFPTQSETMPRLRFAEFRDSEEWEVKEVGEIFTVTRGYVLSMNLINNQISDATPYPVYSSQTKNNGLSGYYSEFLYEDAITWTTDGANAGDVNYRLGKFYCTNVFGVLINTEGYTNLCVASLIDRVAKNHVSYVGNPKLMNGIMRKIKIPIPSFVEQQKIAACLTALDDLISAQTQKIAKLKTHKRGLMQQLFPAVDEMN